MPDSDGHFIGYQLLSWLPDETFFSLVSRLHKILGHATAAQSSQLLFGRARAGMHHDLPNSLDAFVQRTNTLLGDAENIAKERTLLNFYSAFASRAETDNAVACMSSASVAHLKLRLGILTSRFRANHPLKACPHCMKQDMQEVGWSYWHLKHQYPGVWVCTTHQQPLLQSSLKTNGVQRFQWLLPRLRDLEPASALSSFSTSASLLLSISELIEHLVRSGAHMPLQLGELHEVYRTELQQRGWIAGISSLRTAKISAAFRSYCEPLRHIPEFAALAKGEMDTVSQLSRLLRPPRSGTHPLRHLLLIHWLFGDAQHFDRALRSKGDDSQAQAVKASVRPIVDPRKAHLCMLILEEGHSVCKGAHIVGVDSQTALLWAAQAGIAIARRPQKLSTDVRAKAIGELVKGVDKAQVAVQAGVSVGTITRLLLGDAKLHADWSEARIAKTREHSRARWFELLQSSGGRGIKWMRQLEPRTYFWLYRNDRVWLNAHKPNPMPIVIRPRRDVVDWEARDKLLSHLVREAAMRLMLEQHSRRIHLWQLCQQIPDLRAKRDCLHKLPRTLEAIEMALMVYLPSQNPLR